MTNLLNVKRGSCDELNVIIEIPKGSRVKYEVDKDTGLIAFDRVLYTPMHYSTNYGFVPKTLWEDGDPLDVLVLSEEPLVSGCLVKCRVIGALDMIDSGDSDVKILAVPIKDPRFLDIENISDISKHTLNEIQEFFRVYKNLQNKKVEVGEWKDNKRAKEDVLKSFDSYDNS